MTTHAQSALVDDLELLTVKDSYAATNLPQEIPAHLSHDPATNTKQVEPFQFGNRILSEEANVFEFNGIPFSLRATTSDC